MNKEKLRKYIPAFILALHWKYFKSKLGELKTKNTEEVFTYIYKNKYWGAKESVSGDGSTSSETKNISEHLPSVFRQYNIQSMLDIPCGDFYWMQHVNLNGIVYTGADIVADLIAANNKQYGKAGTGFVKLDLTSDSLPTVDLIFVRDCLVHLAEEKVMAAIKNIKRSGSKYLFTTTFTKHQTNKNIITGDWRAINFQISPYNFPSPLLTVTDTVVSAENEYSDKVMALWRIEDLPDL